MSGGGTRRPVVPAAVLMCFFKFRSSKCFAWLDLHALKLYYFMGRAVRHLAAADHDSDVTRTAISMTPVGFESKIAAYFRFQTDVTIVISRRPEVTVECKAVPGNYVPSREINRSVTARMSALSSYIQVSALSLSERGRCHQVSRRMQAFCAVNLPPC